MPVRDWTRVSAGTFHDFHSRWITHLVEAFNDGLLPEDYSVESEQVAGQLVPDVLSFHEISEDTGTTPGNHGDDCRRRVVIRHTSNDRMVALLEIVTPGNKSNRNALRQFVNKALGALNAGLALLLIDLLPPGPRDPAGSHGVIWKEIDEANPFTLPPDCPLTLVAYHPRPILTASIEPTAVGQPLIDMPLFLAPEAYVCVPLEPTYQATWRGLPRRYRRVLEGPA